MTLTISTAYNELPGTQLKERLSRESCLDSVITDWKGLLRAGLCWVDYHKKINLLIYSNYHSKSVITMASWIFKYQMNLILQSKIFKINN